jgi:hypothetical protein
MGDVNVATIQASGLHYGRIGPLDWNWSLKPFRRRVWHIAPGVLSQMVAAGVVRMPAAAKSDAELSDPYRRSGRAEVIC